MTIQATVNVVTNLPLQLTDGDATKFPQGLVYNSIGSLLATVNLTHVANGLYRGLYTFTVTGDFDVVFITYDDAGHTMESTVHGRVTERFISTRLLEDRVWDEDIVAGHGTADTAGLLLRALGAAISQRANNPTLNALLGVADSAGNELPDEIWDEDVVAFHGTSDTSGLLLRILGAEISQRANNATLDSLLGVADLPGETLVTSQIDHFVVRQAWSRSTGPSTLHGVISLDQNGERVTLPGGALLAIQGYDQAGSSLFSQSGISPTTVGSDTWFGVDQAYTLVPGAVITIRATITNSGFGTGTHVGMVQVVTPQF